MSKTKKAKQPIETLGRDFIIPASKEIIRNEANMRVEWHVQTVEVIIGIGKDHTATLIMDEDAYKAFKSGE